MISLYDLSVGSYKQVLGATINVMNKGAEHYKNEGLNLNDVIEMRLISDMAPFPFQVNSVCHHSLGAVNGLLKSEFNTPPKLQEMSYQELTDYLTSALEELKLVNSDEINNLIGKAVYFRAGELEVPFTAENFVQSFSLPNLYFHATTIYDMLRMTGVPLSKRDFLGQMMIGLS